MNKIPTHTANEHRVGVPLRFAFLVWFTAAIAMTVGVGPAWAAGQEPGAANTVFVYYGNETPAVAREQSSNLKLLLTLLRQSKAPIAGKLATIIEADLKGFRRQLVQDESALLEAAQRIGFDLAIFTNTLVNNGEYKHFRRDRGVLKTKRFPELPLVSNEILAFSPLSRPETLKAALTDVAAQYQRGSLKIVLVTFSHGSQEMALMPRVNTDLSTSAAIDAFKQGLENGGGGDAPDWASPQGTGKLAYWKVLEEISRHTGVRFPLVFRQACGSGPNGWREYLAMPDSVESVGHSARYNIDIDQIDYAKLFEDTVPGSDWIEHLKAGLQQREIRVSTSATMWLWAALSSIVNFHPAIFFIPLVAWLLVYGPRLVRLFKARAHTG